MLVGKEGEKSKDNLFGKMGTTVSKKLREKATELVHKVVNGAVNGAVKPNKQECTV